MADVVEKQMTGFEIPLHTRYVMVGGRRFRIREFEDSQIGLRMLIAFCAGLIPFALMSIWFGWSLPDAIAVICK